MKAIVQRRYGSPDLLELRDVAKPVVGETDVLVRVHAASVNAADWHFLTGIQYVLRLASGILRPRRTIPGRDLARDIGETIGITERAAHRIVGELADAGYITRERNGRRNQYEIQTHARLPDPLARGKEVGDLLAILADQT